MSSEVGAPSQAGVIPLCVPKIQGNEWLYTKECLDTNWVSSAGPFVDRFERMVADYVGAKFAVATSSGTAALHVALLIAGVKPGDEVLVSTLTFVAPANAIRYVGAWPVFVDAEPEYWQMDPVLLADFLSQEFQWRQGQLINKKSGRPVTAILPVHILGHPCDMDPIIELARKYGLKIIEDATESLGSKYRGRMVGSRGDITCFSFNGNKLITTGGGGMVVTDDEAWAKKAQYLTTQAKDDPEEYIHHEIGYNYRLSNIQAAMGCAQMEQVDIYIESKRAIAAAYADHMADLPGLYPMGHAPWANSVFWLSTVRVDEQLFGMDSRALMQQLARERIQARPLWQPGHQSPAHAGCQFIGGGVAERLFRECLSLPSSVGLEPLEQERVLAALAP